MHCPSCPAVLSPTKEELARGRMFCRACGGRFRRGDPPAPGDSPFREAGEPALVALPELVRPEAWTDDAGGVSTSWEAPQQPRSRGWIVGFVLVLVAVLPLLIFLGQGSGSDWGLALFGILFFYLIGLPAGVTGGLLIALMILESLFRRRGEEVILKGGTLTIAHRRVLFSTCKRIPLTRLGEITSTGRFVEIRTRWSSVWLSDDLHANPAAAEWVAERIELERLRAR